MSKKTPRRSRTIRLWVGYTHGKSRLTGQTWEEPSVHLDPYSMGHAIAGRRRDIVERGYAPKRATLVIEE